MREEMQIHNERNRKTGEELKEQYAAFISMTTHDLLAPLRKLGVLTDRLTQKYARPEDGETLQYTERIHACINEMRSIVDSCVQIARAIPQNMTIGDVDTGRLLSEIIREKAREFKEKGATVHGGELPLLQGDPTQLGMLFREIIENALVFTKKDLPLELDIRCEDLNQEEKQSLGLQGPGYWKFIFTDNGIGFKSEESERIFEPTIRLHGKSAYPGSGLGLTLVKKIVANHQGCVYAESGKEGSRFIVILPKNLKSHVKG
jgi:signal transduction histidine kinase